MLGKYKLETARPSGWIVEYEGDDAGKYAAAVVSAAVEGRTTRATCIGTRGEAVPRPPAPVNHVNEEIRVQLPLVRCVNCGYGSSFR